MAADPLDEAVALQATFNATALAAHLNENSTAHLPSRMDCMDCDIKLDENRRALGGVQRCVECEGFYQREQFQNRQRAP